MCLKSPEPPKGESNYEEAIEFDPLAHHNQFCPWVNGNVAAAGSSCGSSTSSDSLALCGWQMTLDALDALRSLGYGAIPTVQSESAASLYKVFFLPTPSLFFDQQLDIEYVGYMLCFILPLKLYYKLS